jgi:hypothetical protein
MSNWRSPKLLREAKDRPCMIQIPGICNGDSRTVVACHSNMSIHGRGFSFKSHDWACSWCCAACHRAIDSGTRLTREEKESYFLRGMSRTLEVLFNEGKLK